MTKYLSKMLNDERGATAIEYGLLAALIAVAVIGGMKAVGTQLNGTYTNVQTNL